MFSPKIILLLLAILFNSFRAQNTETGCYLPSGWKAMSLGQLTQKAGLIISGSITQIQNQNNAGDYEASQYSATINIECVLKAPAGFNLSALAPEFKLTGFSNITTSCQSINLMVDTSYIFLLFVGPSDLGQFQIRMVNFQSAVWDLNTDNLSAMKSEWNPDVEPYQLGNQTCFLLSDVSKKRPWMWLLTLLLYIFLPMML